MRVVYADILLTINLAVDYLLLFGTARLAGVKFIRKKGLLSAALGAVYALTILFDFSAVIFATSQIAVSLFMIIVCFGKRKPTEIIRLFAIFYVCGFIFSGFMFLVNYATKTNMFLVKGGIVYFEFSAMEIILSGTAAFLITEILRRLFRHGEPEDVAIAKLFYGGKSIVLKCFLDTGNELCEPFSGVPAAVVNKEDMAEILSKEMLDEMGNKNLSTKFGIRLIPCKTVNEMVLIPAFRPEKLIIKSESGEFEAEEVVVAVSPYSQKKTVLIGKNLILKEKTDKC